MPLLVSTSHHNIPTKRHATGPHVNGHATEPSHGGELRSGAFDKTRGSLRTSLLTKKVVAKLRDETKVTPVTSAPKLPASDGFCSELILWKVDPVGPLSKSGGVTELARLTSPQPSAFSNCAWIPTLLPRLVSLLSS
jgi:hypothetical protein